MAGLWQALQPSDGPAFEGGPSMDDLRRGHLSATGEGIDRITDILTRNRTPSIADVGTAALRAAGGGQPYGQGIEAAFDRRQQQALADADLSFNIADRFADQMTRQSEAGNRDAQQTIQALQFFGWDNLNTTKRAELAKRLTEDPEIIDGDNAYATIGRVFGSMEIPEELDVPKVVTYDVGGKTVTEIYRRGALEPERYEGPRWQPKDPGDAPVPDLVKVIDDAGNVVWTPKSGAAGMRTLGDGDGTGGPTPAQAANNAEIRKSREYLLALNLPMNEINSRSQPLDDFGRGNPDYDPLLAGHLRTALQHQIGDDPDFDRVWGSFYGEVGAPAPADVSDLPLDTSGYPDASKLETGKTYRTIDSEGVEMKLRWTGTDFEEVG